MTHLAPRLYIPGEVIVRRSLLTGTLDAASAVIHHGLVAAQPDPVRIFPFFAGTIFGQAAMAHRFYFWDGLLFYYLIAYLFTATFLLLYPRLRFLRVNWFLVGLLYGAAIWTVMNVFVVPREIDNPEVSAWPITLKGFAIRGGILMAAIGLPVAFIARRTARPLAD